MTVIYCVCIKGLRWLDIQQQKIRLSDVDQCQLDRYKFDQDKCRTFIGKLLLLYILNRHQNDPLIPLTRLPSLQYNAYQKPFLATSGGFNISHAGDWVVCAYNSTGEVGVDIEKEVAFNINDYLAVLTLQERRRIHHQVSFGFFKLWTLKEAVMKADGRGFFLAPDSFELPYPFTNNEQITIQNRTWFLYSQTIKPDYVLSIASSTSLHAVNIIQLPPQRLFVD